MILFMSDWNKYPDAILHLSTKNKTFVDMAAKYKSMGIKNHAWPLALLDPGLADVDPFSNVLSMETIGRIQQEIRYNPIYFFREIARVAPKAGTQPLLFKANRGNLAMLWLFFNHITLFMIQPRQTGKSLTTGELMKGLLSFWTNHTKIIHITKDDKLRRDIIALIKEFEKYLPSYLKMITKKDANNTETITVNRLGNEFKTNVGHMSPKQATGVGRGATSPITWFDEVPFINNIQVIVPAALAAGTAARDEAKLSGQAYGTIFTSTAGTTTTTEGRYAHKLYTSGMPWTEHMFDLKDEEELDAMVSRHTSGVYKLVIVEMNHRQLGYTDAWLQGKIEDAMSEGADAKRDFLNIWAADNTESLLDRNAASLMIKSEMQPIHTTMSRDQYLLNWYISEEETAKYRNRPLIASLDTSEAAGDDAIFMTFREPTTGEVIAAAMYNETNTVTFGKYLFELLQEFNKLLYVIERRSTGGSIMDHLMVLCEAHDIDPFKRIFNWVVNDRLEHPERFEEINMPLHRRDPNLSIKYKKHFGFATSGGGRTSRSMLYGEVFNNAVKYTASVVHDKVTSTQIRSLVKKNGRVDHTASGNDDAVISWLLGYWFLMKGKNVEFYEHDAALYLSAVSFNDASTAKTVENEAKREHRVRQRNKLTDMIKVMRSNQDPLRASIMAVQIKQMMRRMGVDREEGMRIDNEIEKILAEKKKSRRGRAA